MMRYAFSVLTLSFILLLGSCTEVEYASHVAKTQFSHSETPPTQGTFKVGDPYKIDGRWYYPREQYDLTETGIASWYGPGFDGKKTASGEIFDSSELTAAHRTLQMPSLVRVTNLDNGRSLIVRVNDRGPYKRGRVMDVSSKAADLLGFKSVGTAKVKLQVLKEESLKVAEAARSGTNTKGYEVAYNQQGGMLTGGGQQPASYQVASYDSGQGAPLPGPVSSEMLSAPSEQQASMNKVIPGHNKGGEFYPDPVVTEYPVTPSQIYIQAGSFTVYDNAVRLRDTLKSFNQTEIFPTDVQGRSFYRVRMGPLASVEEADEVLARLVQNGQTNAIIVVE